MKNLKVEISFLDENNNNIIKNDKLIAQKYKTIIEVYAKYINAKIIGERNI